MEKLVYYKGKYQADNTTVIIAVEESTGEQYATVSVNLGGYGMKPQNENCIFIPTYNFTEEFMKTLHNDLIKRVVREVPIGYGSGLEVELKDNWKEICQDM